MLELFPDSASIEGGELEVGGSGATALAERFGTPLVVYCEDTLRARARELRAASEARATVALDGESDAERAAAAGVRRVLVRVTLGVEADTHEAIQTGHHGSKFGLPPDAALRTIENARALGLDVAGLHIHVGSQLANMVAHEETIELLAALAARCRDALDWTPAVVNAGGGFAVRHTLQEPDTPLGERAHAVADAVEAA